MRFFKTYLPSNADGTALSAATQIAFWDKQNAEINASYYKEPRLFLKIARNTPGYGFLLHYLSRDGLVFDAGCSSNKVAHLLDTTRRKIIGLDFSLATLLKAKAVNPKGLSVACDLKHLPFADGTLKEMLFYSIAEHDESGPQALLKEAHRVLAPNGRLLALFATPNLEDLVINRLFYWLGYRAFPLMLRKLKLNLVWKPTLQSQDGFYSYFYTRGQAAKFLKKGGFRINRMMRVGFLPGLLRSRLFHERAERYVKERHQKLARGENPSAWRHFWDDLYLREEIYDSGPRRFYFRILTRFYRYLNVFICEKSS